MKTTKTLLTLEDTLAAHGARAWVTLLVGVATLAVAPQDAAAQRAEAVLVANHGELRLHSGPSSQQLMSCTAQHASYLVVEPYELRTYEQPCSFGSLVSDPRTGRWALSVMVFMQPSHEDYTITINGQAHKVPRNKKGEAESNELLVYGDRQGVRHVWPGLLKARDKRDRLLMQSVVSFSEDGDRLWTTLTNGSTYTELWSWRLEPTPSGAQVKAPPVFTSKDSGLLLVHGEPLIVRDANDSKLRMARLPADGSPRLDAMKPLKAGQASWRGPVILGDEVFYYVPGPLTTKRVGRQEIPNFCDPQRTGTYQRMNLKTGLASTWRVHDRCWATGGPFIAPHRKAPALFFTELNAYAQALVYRLELASGAVSPTGLPPDSDVQAVSPDAKQLLVFLGASVGRWDVEAKAWSWSTPVNITQGRAKVAWTLGEPPSEPRAASPL